MGDAKGQKMRTFRVPGLEHEDGRMVFEVGGKAVLAVDVSGGTGTLTSAAGGKPRAITSVDTTESLDRLVSGELHPVVAGLQNRLFIKGGDSRFGLCVALALRASSPRFAQKGG